MADIDYGKYLEAEPTQLMTHIEKWLKDKAGFDPKTARTKEEAFQAGVYLTVHLRTIHQASPENQQRLADNAAAREAVEADRAERREARAAVGAKPRGRLPKTASEDKAAETPAPKRRGRPRKVTEVIPEVPAAEPAAPPKRRGRPRKAAVPVEAAEAPPENVTPIRRPARKTATKTAEAATEPQSKPVRRRAARKGEAAF